MSRRTSTFFLFFSFRILFPFSQAAPAPSFHSHSFMSDIFARCQVGVLVSVGAATCESTSRPTDSVRVGPQDLVAVTWTRRLSSAVRIATL
jgi:hypothetical protein